MSEPIYQLDQVAKAYEGRQVLSIKHLAVQQGEILAVVGPSGAGKSTLLRLLNFLEPPSSGVIRFMGVRFGAAGSVPLSLRRRVTTVFQRPVLLNRNVQANVAYGLRLRRQQRGNALVEAALQQVGLEAMARQHARTLSGGEAQRVALARAMVLHPDVLLLDEPTANLDPYNVRLIEEIVCQLNREQSTTVVLVTHNVFQARRLAHRVMLLLEGQLIEVADTTTFFESPEDSRTRSFVCGELVY
ncbi:MAG: phosphate ABC transporter ATP-binding protein [Anaerolineae bacterium]|nr:phosphate ABC transporter ATP-binding protein [Anaerolineae bacterium]